MSQKIIRDPVHDVIAFQTDSPTDALLFQLINADEFQRLRRVRQLGMATLAYPGADHSRYSHSLGVMETARKILAHVRRSNPIGEADFTACVVGALLHDLGHGPFSHVFERISGVDHEDITRQIVQDPASQIHQHLIAFDPSLPERVLAMLSGAGRRTFLHDILSSQLDADRFDYLLRDNLMTGSGYGNYDLTWLLHALVVDEGSGRLAVTIKGVSAVEAYLQARYHMYRNVYFHKVVRSGEGMVKLALQRARRLAIQERLLWPLRESAMYKALMGQQLSFSEFIDLDDVSVMHCFKLWCHSDDRILAMLCHGLLYRRVFKTIDLTRSDTQSAAHALARAHDVITGAGGEPDYEMFFDEAEDTPYEFQSFTEEASAADVGHLGKDILVRDNDGKLTTFSSISPLSRVLNRQLMFRRLHVAGAYRDGVRDAIRGLDQSR